MATVKNDVQFSNIDAAIANVETLETGDRVTFLALGTRWYVTLNWEYSEDEEDIDWDNLEEEETYFFSRTNCDADSYVNWIHTADTIVELLIEIKEKLEDIAQYVDPAYLD